jgi:hypothetical protein
MKTLFIVLVLLVASSLARAEEWVVLRKPAEIGESAPAGISVDSASIEILESGIRRARVKVASESPVPCEGRKSEQHGRRRTLVMAMAIAR